MARGIDLERRVRDWLRHEGWFVVRAAGSLGICDLVALRWAGLEEPQGKAMCDAMLVEVKGDKRSPWVHFGPAKQRALIAAEKESGAEAWMCWMAPRVREPTWIPSSEFPVAKKDER